MTFIDSSACGFENGKGVRKGLTPLLSGMVSATRYGRISGIGYSVTAVARRLTGDERAPEDLQVVSVDHVLAAAVTFKATKGGRPDVADSRVTQKRSTGSAKT
jgi:hypothetical protein